MGNPRLHDFNRLRFNGPKVGSRGIAILGEVGTGRTESVEAAVRRFKDRNIPVLRSGAESSDKLFTELSTRNLTGSDMAVVAENAAEYLKEGDVPKLHRLLSKTDGQTHLIITGTKFVNPEVEQQFKRSMCATFKVNFSGTEAGQNNYQVFLEKEFGITERQSALLAVKLQYSVDNAVQLARKAKAFDEISYSELEDLVVSSTDIAFTEALIRLKLADAMELTQNMTRDSAEMTLLSVVRQFRHITTIYPVTRQVKIPGVQQSKQTRLPLRTIQRWWAVAGRYPPREQIRRHLLLVETSDRIQREPNRAKNTFGAFERLVLGW